MAGYIRQSTFQDGDTITAALFNDEYNQLLAVFNNSTGHKHDGTTAEGPVIGLIGDAGLTTPLNKILIDTTNDHIEFWLDVSGTSTQQLYIADGAILPVTDNDIDLGSSSLEFKDLYIDGTANIDSLVADTADINGGTLDDVTIGATTAAAGTFTTVDTSGNVTVGGNLTVSGTTTTVNSNEVNIGDNILLLNSDETGTPSQNAGLEVERGTSTNVSLLWNETNDYWTFGSDHLNFPDNSKAYFGDSNDLQIYHDGSNNSSYIKETGAGSLYIEASNLILQREGGTESFIQCITNGAVTLYYDNAAKLATTSSGIDVTGDATLDNILSPDNTSLTLISGGNSTNAGANYTLFGGSHASLANVHRWRNGSTEIARFDGSGNLGIGTDSPASALHIRDASNAEITIQDAISSATARIGVYGAGGNLTYDTNASGEHIFTTNNRATEFMRIDSSGNVGIGTDSPSTSLHLASTNPIIRLEDTDGTDQYGQIKYNGTLFDIMSRNGASDGVIRFGGHGSGNFTEYARFASSGRLGIGTSSPSVDLHVNSTQPRIRTQDSEGDNTYLTIEALASGVSTLTARDGTSHGEFRFRTTTGTVTEDRMSIDSSGNVGIGTTSPSALLHVEGNALVTGNLTVNGNLTFGNAATDTVSFGADIDSHIIPDDDDTYDLGSSTQRWRNLYIDGVASLDQVGIGTDSPSAPLQVVKTTSSTIPALGAASSHVAFGGGLFGTMIGSLSSGKGYIQQQRFDGTATAYDLAIQPNGGNLGIGTTSPTYKLDVAGEIRSSSRLWLSTIDAVSISGSDLRIGYSNNNLLFRTNSGERMRIDSSGNLLVGKTAANNTTQGTFFQASDGFVSHVSSGNTTLLLNRLTSEGTIALFRYANSDVGNIGSLGSYLTIGDEDTAIRFHAGVDAILPHNSSTNANRDDAISLGTSTERFKDLHLSGDANIGGNLTVSGTTTTIDTTNLNVEDKNITINYSTGDSSSTADGAGITIQDAVDASTDASLTWNATNDVFEFSHGLDFGDNEKIRFGASQDLEIYHDGSNSYIQDSGTGNLRIAGQSVDILNPDANEFKARFVDNGRVELYYDNSKKFETTSSGIDVTGSVTGDSIVSDGGAKSVFTNTSSSAIDLSGGTSGALQIGTSSSTVLATIAGRQTNTTQSGLGFYSATADGNTSTVGDMHFNVRENDNSTFATLTKKAFVWTHYTSELMHLTRGGNLFVTGNVGIGTTSPSVKFEVNGGADAIAKITGTSTAARLDLATTTHHVFMQVIESDGRFRIFDQTAANEYLTISNAGNVGIGTSSPDTLLNLAGDETAVIRLENSNGSASDGDVIGALQFYKADASGAGAGVVGQMKMLTQGVGSGGHLTLSTGDTNGNDVERLRISSNGNVGIGTTLPSETLQVAGNLALNDGIFASQSTNYTRLYANNGEIKIYLGGVDQANYYDNNAHIFRARDTSNELMRINATGLGIGTGSPSNKLHIAANSGNTILELQRTNTNTTGTIGAIQFNANDDHAVSAIVAIGDGDDEGSHLAFNTTSAASANSYFTSTTERMRIDSSGNVGIGTSSPSAKLDVAGDIIADGLTIDAGGTWASSLGGLQLDYSSPEGFITTYYDSNSLTLGAGVTQKTGITINGHTSSDGSSIEFRTGNSETARFDSSGNFGIGTTSPESTLEIANSDQTNGTTLSITNSFSGSNWEAGDTVGTINFRTDDWSTTEPIRGQIKVFDDASDGTNTYPFANAMSFSTGYVNTLNERMRISSNGNVGIGTDSPTRQLHVKNSATATLLLQGNATTGYSQVLLGDTDAEAPCYLQYYHAEDSLRIATNGSERMRINSVGQVGIGTTSPSTQLHLEGSAPYFRTKNTSAPTDEKTWDYNAGTDGTFRFRAINDAATDANNWMVVDRSGVDINYITMSTGNQVEALRINSSGNLGIGTTSPTVPLEVSGHVKVGDADGSSSAGDSQLNVKAISGEDAIVRVIAPSGNDSELRLGVLGTSGVNSLKFGDVLDNDVGYIQYDHGSNYLRFGTNAGERARIDSSGNFLVGKTSANSATTGIELHQDGLLAATRAGNAAIFNRTTSDGVVVQFRRDNSIVGSVSVTTTATTYNTSSDARLKDDIGDFDGLGIVKQLNPRKFAWKADGQEDIGLYAQEVKELVPNAVSQNEDGYYQMDYSKLVTPLIKAIQEQQEQIESLKSEIKLLKGGN